MDTIKNNWKVIAVTVVVTLILADQLRKIPGIKSLPTV